MGIETVTALRKGYHLEIGLTFEILAHLKAK
jgi:hypothetical protein